MDYWVPATRNTHKIACDLPYRTVPNAFDQGAQANTGNLRFPMRCDDSVAWQHLEPSVACLLWQPTIVFYSHINDCANRYASTLQVNCRCVSMVVIGEYDSTITRSHPV